MFTASGGADGVASVGGYALNVSAPDVDSGLLDTATGEKVLLSKVGDEIHGKTEIGGLLVFKVTVSAAGLVTLDQVRAVKHPVNPAPDDSIGLAAANRHRSGETPETSRQRWESAAIGRPMCP